MLFGTKYINEFIYFNVKFLVLGEAMTKDMYFWSASLSPPMQVHDGHPGPPVPSVHPPLHILNPHLYMEQVGDADGGNGDVDDGVLSSFLTLTFISSRAG